jgi:hypothetical protein
MVKYIQRIKLLQRIATMLFNVRSMEVRFQKTKNLLRKMPRYKYIPRLRRKRPLQRNRDLGDWDFETLGVDEELFERLLALISGEIKLKMKRSLSIAGMLRLTLRWLREYPSYSLMGELVGLDKTNIGRIVRQIVPVLFEKLDFIKFPEYTDQYIYEGAFAAIDCSSHFRERVLISRKYLFSDFSHRFFQDSSGKHKTL